MPVNPLQITDPNASDNPLAYAPSWIDAAGVASGGVDRVSQWLAEQRAKNMGRREAEWTEQLKRLVNPYVDPRMEQQPRYPNTDQGLNRTGPRVGEVIGV